MFKSQKSSNNASIVLNNDKQECSERKIVKNKSQSKKKNFFKKIFSSNDNVQLKSEVESEFPVFENDTDFDNGLNEPLNTISLSSPNNIEEIVDNVIILRSDNVIGEVYTFRNSEPIFITDELSRNNIEAISVCESSLLNVSTLLPCNVCDQTKKDLLTIPIPDNSRKSSDNDSAVDMKFPDEMSDQNDQNIEKVINLKCATKPAPINRHGSSTSWRILKAALIWTPFMQQYARYRYPWIQIAGHQGNFKPGEQGTILKKHSSRESICLQLISADILSDFIPKFKGDVDYDGEKYICMQDLLAQFNTPSLMDIKMGTRTYLEEELGKANVCPKPRQDMYEKMIEVDIDEPTEEEHQLRAVIKSRYMQWRESLSSTLSLGFRIEGVKKTRSKSNKNVGTQSRNFKRTKYRHEVKESLLDFIDNNLNISEKFIRRIEFLRKNLEKSNFFWEHELIGSSLLFVHDKSGKANIWMIDFGKTVPVPPMIKIDHESPWIEGNHEDGYLFGLQNLLSILKEIHSEILIDSS